MPTNLAPVYLDDARVQLQGDPKPRVSKIVAAGGKSFDEDVVVVRLREQGDAKGSPVRLEDVIDRAHQDGPVYLRCVPNGPSEASFAADESTGVGGSVTQIEAGGLGQGDRFDPDSSIGNRVRPGTGSTRKQQASAPQFGAAKRGIAGQGAKDSPGDVPPDKQAKSDAPSDQRSGGSNQTYGAGDLQPGGRTGLGGKRPASGNPDSTQEFQSGGRQGGGLPASHPAQSAGQTSVRQAGRRPAPASRQEPGDPGDLRDQSTDHSGRQQGQRPARSREGDDSTTSAGAD